MNTKRKVRSCLALMAAACFASAHAQIPSSRTPVTPGEMNYQGRLATPSGTPYSNTTYSIEFRLWKASSGGTTPLWGAKYLTYVKDGYFNVVLGAQGGSTLTTNVPTYGPQELWKALWFSATEDPNTVNERYLGITVLQDNDGNNLPADEVKEAFPRQRLFSSPFAERAEMAQYAQQSIAGFYVPGTLKTGGSVTMSNSLTVVGTTALQGNATASGTMTLNNGVVVNNAVADLNGGVDVSGAMSYLRNGVEVTGSAALKGGATVTGNLSVPSGAISASGNVTLGGGLYAPGAGENLRIVRGNVNGDGTLAQGSGFTVSRIGGGRYRVTFSTAFSAVPSVVASAGDLATDEDNIADVNYLGTASFEVNTWDAGQSSNTSEDSWFSFIAIGPR